MGGGPDRRDNVRVLALRMMAEPQSGASPWSDQADINIHVHVRKAAVSLWKTRQYTCSQWSGTMLTRNADSEGLRLLLHKRDLRHGEETREYLQEGVSPGGSISRREYLQEGVSPALIRL